jgi:diketogulonate reductase-like aldo/keto reductase
MRRTLCSPHWLWNPPRSSNPSCAAGPARGWSSRRCGSAIATSIRQVYENGVRRDEVFITTKVWTSHFAPHELERSTKESLTRLRVSEVDLLLLHWPNPRVPLSETLGALAHAIPRTSRLERLSENMEIIDFELSEDEMRRISVLGGSNGRLTDYGFAPKWD